MKKPTWSDVFDKTTEPTTKKDYEEFIKWAENEIKEYQDFIKLCKKKIKDI